MIYDVPAITALAQQCAPEIAVEAIVPLVMTESGGDPLRINVNKGPRVRAASVGEGAAIVRRSPTFSCRILAAPASLQFLLPSKHAINSFLGLFGYILPSRGRAILAAGSQLVPNPLGSSAGSSDRL